MEQIMNYVKPELIVVAVVLYLIGIGLKKAGAVYPADPRRDRYRALRGVGARDQSAERSAGYLYGCIYSGNTGDPCGGTEHLCESDCQAGWKSRIKNICLRRSAHQLPSLLGIW